MQETVDISITIVTYHSLELISSCLESLFAGENKCRFEVIIQDNDSQDGIIEWINQHYPQVKTLASPSNVGFGTGQNRAVAHASGQYILILNPDTEMPPYGLDELLSRAKAIPRLGILAPRLVFHDGSLQRSAHRRFPSWLSHFVHYNFIVFTLLQRVKPGFDFTLFSPIEHERPLDCRHVMGAVMLMPKAVFERIGGFDEAFFLYLEETDLCRRLYQAGYIIRFDPTISVIHALGGSSGETDLGQGSPYFIDSTYRYFRKHYGSSYSQRLFLVSRLSLKLNAILLKPLAAIARRFHRTNLVRYVGLGQRLCERAGSWHNQHAKEF